MNQSVKHLLCKYGVLSSNPRTYVRSRTVCDYNLSAGKAQTGGSLETFASLPSLTCEFLTSERPRLRKQDDGSRGITPEADI